MAVSNAPTWHLSSTTICIGILFLIVSYVVSFRFRPYLRKVPGPFLASISHVPRLRSVQQSNMHLWMVKLHRRYGPVVRVGPNHISIADPSALHTIYSTGSGYVKSEQYSLWDAKHGPDHFIPTNFSCRDEQVHKAMVRSTLSAYSMANILKMEGLLNDCIETFENEVSERIARSITDSAVMDLSQWLHYFAFDVVTNMTFSNSFGFMEAGGDVDGIINAVEGRLKYNCFVSQWPVWHSYLLRSELGSRIANWIPAFAIMNTSAKLVELTRREVKRQEEEKSEGYIDMLNIWRAKTHEGIPMTDGELVGASVANVLAGSHSTAGGVRNLLYCLIKNPSYLTRLREEITDTENLKGLDDIVTYHQTKDMHFLQACIKESMRVKPGFGMNLERIVPEGGLEVAGYFLPANTVVGVNPWSFGRNLDVYGEDADIFRPERWLEAWTEAGTGGETAKAKLQRMENNFFNFSMGNRGCIGRNLALMVINKLTIQILRRFDLELVEPEKDLEPQNLFFVNELGMNCRLRARTS